MRRTNMVYYVQVWQRKGMRKMKKQIIMLATAFAAMLSGAADTEAVAGVETDATDQRPVSELWPSGVEGGMRTGSVYNGYLHDGNGLVVGLITVNVGKLNAATKLAPVSARVVGLNKTVGLSVDAKGGKVEISADGPTRVGFKRGRSKDTCTVTLGAAGMSGHYNDYYIEGSLNVFSSKAEEDKAVASAALDKWQSMVNVVWPGAQGWNGLFMKIGTKGRAKVRGRLADGKSVTVNGQLIVGEKGCCVPVVSTKNGKAFAFNVWLQDETGILPSTKVSVANAEAEAGAVLPEVVGIADAVVGRPGNLKSGAKFHMDAVMGDAQYAQYLPDGVPVEGGEKWTLPKAGRVVQLTSTREVLASSLGENPSALKLTYNAKDGSFKGSFKTYAFGRGRLKSTVVKVRGLLVNGVGYGMAEDKNVSVPVTIE